MIVGTVMLILLLLAGGADPLSGAFPKDFQKRIDHVIAEPARADRVVAEWKGLQKDVIRFNQELEGLTQRLLMADDARGTRAAELEYMLGQIEPSRIAAQEKGLDRLLAIRGNMSPTEWAAVFGDSTQYDR